MLVLLHSYGFVRSLDMLLQFCNRLYCLFVHLDNHLYMYRLRMLHSQVLVLELVLVMVLGVVERNHCSGLCLDKNLELRKLDNILNLKHKIRLIVLHMIRQNLVNKYYTDYSLQLVLV